MEPHQVVTNVSIEPTCIACDLCQTICPRVFVRTADGCRLCPDVADPAFLAAHSGAILQAAAACPVWAITTATADASVQPAAPHARAGDPSLSAGSPVRMGRRRFGASMGWLALAGSGAVVLTGLKRFMQPDVAMGSGHRVAVGPLSKLAEHPVGTVIADSKGEGFWVVRLKDGLVAMSTACPHLGCVLNWEANERKFKCPCHGSVFDGQGINVEGPAPGPMVRFGITVEEDTVYVDRGRSYRLHEGRPPDPGSFIALV